MNLSALNGQIYLLFRFELFLLLLSFSHSKMELVQFINEVSKNVESDKEKRSKNWIARGKSIMYFCVYTLNLNATKHKPIY